MNIRNSLYRVVFILTVLPFFLFSLLITHIYSGRLERVITESLSVVADAQIAEMTNFCEQQKEYLTLIGMLEASRAAMNGEQEKGYGRYLDNMLYSYVRTMNHMKTLAIIDSDKRVVACSSPEHAAFAEDGVNYIIEKMDGRDFYITDVLNDGKGGKTLVEIARLEENGELLGYALGEINLDFYGSIREQAQLWNESTFYLLDGRQQIVSAGTPKEGRDEFVTTQKERGDYNKKYQSIDFEKYPQGNFRYKIGGVNYITYYSDVEYTDWQVMLTVNMDVYRAERIVYIILGSFLVFLCIVLTLWIGWFASKRIVHPIRHISEILKDIQEKQDYSLRVDIRSKDEIGKLSEGINELISFIETEDLYKMQQQRLLHEKASQDALTKVLNKERINEYLQEMLRKHRMAEDKLAVLFVDVDDFKAFNTNYGHMIGDQVLQFVTSVLTQETNGTVGRVGGDEFLVIIEDHDKLHKLDACLQRLKELAENKFSIQNGDVHIPISCCIGAVQIDFGMREAQDLTPEQMIHMADEAMYQAKNNGKHGHVIFTINSDFS